ncbi:MAG: hypothetical protein AABZ60_20880 [Planctomycetota bacterium]
MKSDPNSPISWPEFLLQEMAEPWLFQNAILESAYPILFASGAMLYQFKKKSQQGKYIRGEFQGKTLEGIRLAPGTCELELVLHLLKKRAIRGLLFFSICGALDSALSIGEIVQVTSAQIGEGMSLYYGSTWGATVAPFQTAATDFPRVCAYTTQSLMRETEENLRLWSKNAQVIDCEFSALFTLSQHLQLPTLAISVVSDLPLKQKNGMRTPAFRQGCQTALRFLQQIQHGELFWEGTEV